MKWEIITTLRTGHQLPPWEPGFDRTQWVNPFRDNQAKRDQRLLQGDYERFCLEGEYTTVGPEFDTVHHIYNNLAAAEEDREEILTIPHCVSCEIVERPDL